MAILFFLVAVLYSSVGHAGASGYLMVMALCDMESAQMRPTALVLNLFVASLTVYRFHKAGHMHPKACIPLLAGSIPLAFLGGATPLSAAVYKALVGVCLAAASARLLFTQPADQENGVPPLPGVMTGAVIGLLAGLTGTGGGIFLTPCLIFAGWQGARNAAGTSALFILVNSVSGLAAMPSSLAALPSGMPMYVVAAIAGGLIGSWLGSRRLEIPRLRQVLALVLAVAAAHIFHAAWLTHLKGG